MLYRFQKNVQPESKKYLVGMPSSLNIAHVFSSVLHEDGPVLEKKEAMMGVLYDLVCLGKASRRTDFFLNCLKFFDFDFKSLQENDVFLHIISG